VLERCKGKIFNNHLKLSEITKIIETGALLNSPDHSELAL
jgi:hypothetical protein